jgi:colanic acid/amylovoran biosynthesis glycosyltransferase
MKERKELILLTHYYPFGKKESYIETEVKYLSASFKKVHIFNVGKHSVYTEKRVVPENFTVLLSNHHEETKKIFLLLKHVFSILFFEELFNLIFVYRKSPSYVRIKAILSSLRNASSIKKSIQNKIDMSNPSMIIYSYWSDDNAIAIALLARQFHHHKYYVPYQSFPYTILITHRFFVINFQFDL